MARFLLLQDIVESEEVNAYSTGHHKHQSGVPVLIEHEEALNLGDSTHAWEQKAKAKKEPKAVIKQPLFLIISNKQDSLSNHHDHIKSKEYPSVDSLVLIAKLLAFIE